MGRPSLYVNGGPRRVLSRCPPEGGLAAIGSTQDEDEATDRPGFDCLLREQHGLHMADKVSAQLC
jgi:hypothetical protein